MVHPFGRARRLGCPSALRFMFSDDERSVPSGRPPIPLRSFPASTRIGPFSISRCLEEEHDAAFMARENLNTGKICFPDMPRRRSVHGIWKPVPFPKLPLVACETGGDGSMAQTTLPRIFQRSPSRHGLDHPGPALSMASAEFRHFQGRSSAMTPHRRRGCLRLVAGSEVCPDLRPDTCVASRDAGHIRMRFFSLS